MREWVMSVRVTCPADMAKIEEKLGQILGGQKCALVRSRDYISLRLCALYDRGKPPMSAYYQNVQICLRADKTVTLYLLAMNPVQTTVSEEEVKRGKRRCRSESPEDEPE